jgi:AcrR family transcriptional regulator
VSERRGRRRSGRRSGDSGTREAILAAARARFAEAGYDRATIRTIAAAAGVDPALVHHYFGPKERLFAAAMKLPVVPGEVVAAALAAGTGGDGGSPGENMLATMLAAWDVAEMRAAFLGLLRTAVASEQGVAMLREYATGVILSRVADAARQASAAGHPGQAARPPGHAAGEADLRATLVASQVLGLALTRYVLQLGPLAKAGNAELAAAIGPTLDRYLSGPLTPAASPPPRPRSRD